MAERAPSSTIDRDPDDMPGYDTFPPDENAPLGPDILPTPHDTSMDPANFPSLFDRDGARSGSPPDTAGSSPGTGTASSERPTTFRTPLDVVATPDTAESVDTNARYADAELLGKSYPVRRAVNEAGIKGVKAWQGTLAKIRNGVATPRRLVRQFAVNRAQAKLNRKEERVAAATNERLRERRQVKADEARANLNQKTARRDQHVATMEARTNAVQERADTKREEYINELKGKREDALARKVVRTQLRHDGASRRETRAIVKSIHPERLNQVGKVAIVAETSFRHHTTANARMDNLTDRRIKTRENISTTEENLKNYDHSVAMAAREAERISEVVIPDAVRLAAEAHQRLEGVAEDDPRHAELAMQAELADHRLNALHKQLNESLKEVRVNNRRSAKANGRLARLGRQQTAQSRSVLPTAQHVHTTGATAHADRAALRQTVGTVLNETRRES